MHNYKITVAYDGTRYKGWQSQKTTDATIQGKLETILEKAAGRPITVIGSGRTDAGVHAKGQTANFYLQDAWEAEELLELFNQYLPEDIAVLSVKEAKERFHSRFSATEKTYQYRIHTGKVPEVFERKYVYSYGRPLHVENMKKAAEYMTGTKDFASFCGQRFAAYMRFGLKRRRLKSLFHRMEAAGKSGFSTGAAAFCRAWCAL